MPKGLRVELDMVVKTFLRMCAAMAQNWEQGKKRTGDYCLIVAEPLRRFVEVLPIVAEPLRRFVKVVPIDGAIVRL